MVNPQRAWLGSYKPPFLPALTIKLAQLAKLASCVLNSKNSQLHPRSIDWWSRRGIVWKVLRENMFETKRTKTKATPSVVCFISKTIWAGNCKRRKRKRRQKRNWQGQNGNTIKKCTPSLRPKCTSKGIHQKSIHVDNFKAKLQSIWMVCNFFHTLLGMITVGTCNLEMQLFRAW